MNKIAKIKYNKSFLRFTNKIIKNNNIIISRCQDIEPNKKGPVFINCTTVFFDDCDKNMIYYWMDRYTFPNVENIYLLNTHPCDFDVFRRFNDTNVKIYLDKNYSRYKNRWAKENNNVIILDSDLMIKSMNSYSYENIITNIE